MILDLLKSFPAFASRWEKYLADSGGKSDGSYIDIAEFVHFVVEDLFETGQMDEVRKVFAKLENSLIIGDEDTKGLVVLGFLETLQCVTSWNHMGIERSNNSWVPIHNWPGMISKFSGEANPAWQT
ncbi:MAG: hypothetical protein WCE52_12650 [Candidatus Acidiferrum sp.]